MNDISSLGGFFGIGRLARYFPEPASSVAGAFHAIFSKITNATAPLEGATADDRLSGLMAEQIAQQERMQAISLYSNVAKSEHEAEMAPIRNIRVG